MKPLCSHNASCFTVYIKTSVNGAAVGNNSWNEGTGGRPGTNKILTSDIYTKVLKPPQHHHYTFDDSKNKHSLRTRSSKE